MKTLVIAVGLCAAIKVAGATQSTPNRMIDLCAQDGYKVEIDDLWSGKSSIVSAGHVGDIDLRVRQVEKDSADDILAFSRHGKLIYQTPLEAFEGPYGWLTVSEDGKHFAFSWKSNATVSRTKIFAAETNGTISEDRALIAKLLVGFVADARHACSDPAVNLQAIKWIDRDHLLLAANSWSSLTCQTNFDEGFIVQPDKHLIEKRLSGKELINLPAVCTWNIVPLKRP